MHYPCNKYLKRHQWEVTIAGPLCMVQKSKSRPPNTRGKKTRGAYSGKDEEERGKKNPTHST